MTAPEPPPAAVGAPDDAGPARPRSSAGAGAAVAAAAAAAADDAEARLALAAALVDTLSAVGAGFWELDLATGRTTWSDGMYRLLGYDPSTTTPSSAAWQARMRPEDHARVVAMSLAPQLQFEYPLLVPGALPRWVRTTMQTVFDADGAPRRLRGLLLDIERERAAAAQLARLAEVAGRTENLVVITDLDGRIEWVNAAFVQRTGWTLPEVAGRRPGELLQGPHTDPATVAVMRAAVRARQPFDVEVLNYSRDGRQYWVEIEARLAQDEHGAPIGYVALETDITAARLAAQRDQLAQRVAAALLSCDAAERAAQAVVDELVRELDVRVAQLWLVDEGRDTLRYVAGAHAAGAPRAREFLDVTRALTFRAGAEPDPGIGIPGAAWGLGRTWVGEHLTRNAHRWPSRRMEVGQAVDILTLCGTPILGPDGVLGVIEVGGTGYYPGHDQLPGLLERVAEQVAAFLLQDASRQAFASIFSYSPDALLLVGADGAVRDANQRARELFGPPAGRRLDDLLDGGGALAAALEAGAGPRPALATMQARGAAGAFSAEVSAARLPAARAAVVAVRDLTERHRMEQALTRSLREKETLLKEIHHRVKNNLQIVSSLLGMQGDRVAEDAARSALQESAHRVRAMAFVHQQLYGTHDLDHVDVATYAATLCRSLQESLAPDAEVTLRLRDVQVGIDQAIPVGLILNELITNALKHGRRADGGCALTVEIEPVGPGLRLAVADDGPGFAAPPGPGTLGVQLIQGLARQLRGSVTFSDGPGARVTLTVPALAAVVSRLPPAAPPAPTDPPTP